MRKLSHVPIVFAGMKEVILKSNPLSLFNLGRKPMYFRVITKDMKEFILERNLTNVINVVKPLHTVVIFKSIKELVL